MANVPITKFAGNAPFDANVSTGVAKLIGFRLAFTLWGISGVSSPVLESGTLRPIVGKELPLAEAARAHKEILEPGAFGKIVLVA